MLPLPPGFQEAIDQLVHAEGHHLVSVAGTIRRARAEFPDFPATDDELTKYIAARAAQRGQSLEFGELE